MKHLVITAIVGCLVSLAASGAAEEVFNFNFDKKYVEDTVESRPYNFYGLSLLQGGETSLAGKHGSAGTASAFVNVDFRGKEWGAILLSDPALYDLRETELKVAIRTTSSNISTQGVVGFKIIDKNGCEYRTGDDELFPVTTEWQVITQHIEHVRQADKPGFFELSNVVQVGVIFMNPHDESSIEMYHVDDFSAKKLSLAK